MSRRNSVKVPVYIISGYLGAGKTTLIREFLQNPGPWRACVLVNDFGKINLDAALIQETGADTIALTNGCACCSIGDDLLAGVQQVMDGPVPYDLIIVEASGVAQPGRIAMLAAGVAGTKPARCLTVVNMAKARQLAGDKFVGRLFHQQVTQADVLSLNRTETDKRTDGLLPAAMPRFDSLQHFLTTGEASVDVHTGPEPDGSASPAFRQKFLPINGFDEQALRKACSDLPDKVHRAKGFVTLLHTDGRDRHVYVDVVQGDVTITPAPSLPDEQTSGLVLISTHQ